jgi:hypothetical protein
MAKQIKSSKAKRPRKPGILVPLDPSDPRNPDHLCHDEQRRELARELGRAQAATQTDSIGNWSQFATQTLARTDRGAAIWENRTNSIRNNAMAGAQVMTNGVELTTNGNFASAGAGWTTGIAGAGSVVFATGSVTITGDGSTNGSYIAQQITGLTVGRNYILSIVSTTFPSMNCAVGSAAGSNSVAGFNNLVGNGANSTFPDRLGFTATATSHWITIAHVAANGGVVTSVSVQDGERCQNGGFTSNPLSASQSTMQNGWQWRRDVAGQGTVTYGTNSVLLTGNGGANTVRITAPISTVSGCTYTIIADITGTTAGVQVGTASYGTTILNITSSVGTGQKFQFTASGTTTWISFSKNPALTSTIANVSVQSAGALPTNWIDSPA